MPNQPQTLSRSLATVLTAVLLAAVLPTAYASAARNATIDPLDAVEKLLNRQHAQLNKGDLVTPSLLELEGSKLDGVRDLLAISGSSRDSFSKAVALAKRGVLLRSRAAGGSGAIDAAPSLVEYDSPSAVAMALLARYDVTPTQTQRQALFSLDDLSPAVGQALAQLFVAFLDYDRATKDGFARLGWEGIEAIERHFKSRTARNEAFGLSAKMDSDGSELAELAKKVDLGQRLAAYLPLLDAAADLRTALAIAPASHSQSAADGGADADGGCESAAGALCLRIPLILAIDLRTTKDHGTSADNVYASGENYQLSIDAGGNDKYLNNAGGSCVHYRCSINPGYVAPGPLEGWAQAPSAAALLDLGSGRDAYGDVGAPPTQAANGGGIYAGSGMLVDDGGNDSYVGGTRALNGGGDAVGSGMLVDGGGSDSYRADSINLGNPSATNGGGWALGSGMLVDVGGDDSYEAEGFGANGGAIGGLGMLLDAGGADRYTAAGSGTNGGGSLSGDGLLLDAEGSEPSADDSYTAGSFGTNGGGYLNGSGMLLDEAGHDDYLAGSDGSNGGATLVRSKLASFDYTTDSVGRLFDLGGRDRYQDSAVPGGAARDCTVSPKGESRGIQVDAEGEGTNVEMGACTVIPTAPVLASNPGHPADDDNPKVQATTSPGSVLELYEDARCLGNPVATAPVDAAGTAAFSVLVPDDSVTEFSAAATRNNETSICSLALEYTEDSTPPLLSIDALPEPLTTTLPTLSGVGGKARGDTDVLANVFVGERAVGIPFVTLAARVSKDGRWSVTLSDADRLSPGSSYTVDVIQQDHALNTSRLTRRFSIAAGATPVPDGTRPPRPTIMAITPDAGSLGGGTDLRLVGTGLSKLPYSSIKFGLAGLQAVKIISSSATELRIQTPAGPATGSVPVWIASGLGTATFTYCCKDRSAGVVPAAGPSSGGTEVTILGRGFKRVTGVTFGHEPALYFRVDADTAITAVAPPQPVGTVAEVQVVFPSGEESPLSEEFPVFEYRDIPLSPPVVSRVTPSESASDGGGEVAVEGNHLYPGKVLFGQDSPTQVVWHSEKRIVVHAPPHPGGAVHVAVETPSGKAEKRFVYGSGTWTSVGASERRVWHAATLLQGPLCLRADRPSYCGKILLTGGGDTLGKANTTFSDMALATAELFDPAQGMTQALPPMHGARLDHTATLLDGPACRLPDPKSYCGKVLVVGGVGRPRGHAAVPGAELFDPAALSTTAAWRSHEAGDCSVPDSTCPASISLLPEVDPTNPPRSFEHPLNPFSRLITRFDHTATLLDGPECHLEPWSSHCGKVLVVGGSADNLYRSPTASVVLYDPATGSWSPGPRLDSCTPASPSCTARASHTATLLEDGRVLVTGGLGPGPHAGGLERDVLKSAQIYDPTADGIAGNGKWFPTGSMTVNRLAATATLIEDQACSETPQPSYCGAVLITGGFRVVDYRVHKEDHEATVVPDAALYSTELYFPDALGPTTPSGTKGAFAAADNMHVARAAHSATPLLGGRVLVVGSGPKLLGEAESERRVSAEIFDPSGGSSGEWTYTSFLRTARGGHTATVWRGAQCTSEASLDPRCGAVVVTGGSDRLTKKSEAVRAAELYFPPPQVLAVTPYRSDLLGPGREVVITGRGFAGATSLAFGDSQLPATGFTVESPTEIKAVAPSDGIGTVDIVVTTPGGRSNASLPKPASRFTYVGTPSAVGAVSGTATSESTIDLSFGAASLSGVLDQRERAATEYIVKQSREPFTEANFEGAKSLCGGVCTFDPPPQDAGDELKLSVRDLFAHTNYHFALRAKAGEKLGALATTSVKTLGEDLSPGTVTDLAASALTHRKVKLSFSAPGDDGSEGVPAREFVIKQSREPITDENFAAAGSLCEPSCSFDPGKTGDALSLEVKDLDPDTTYHYALKAMDEGGNVGPMSNVVSTTTEPDTIAPDAVTDLSAQPLSGSELALTFSAPASDAGEGPPVTDYVIKQAREPITDATFEAAKTLCDGTCEFTPAAPGEKLTLSVTGLESSSTYHYALKAIDEGSNNSSLSNTAFATTSKVTPGKVTGLKTQPKSMSKIALTFSAADDGTGEAATSYLVKQSNKPIRSEDSFSKAKTLCGDGCRFDVGDIGDILRLSVTGLHPATNYHYAIRALDDSGDNLGPRSRSVTATTRPDRIDPGRVDDLKAKALSKTAVKLLFSAVASNGSKGPGVITYIIKQSNRPIRDAGDFRKAQSLCGKVCSFDAGEPGARLNLKVTDLRAGTTYYYAVTAVDRGDNRGPRSNSARARTSRR